MGPPAASPTPPATPISLDDSLMPVPNSLVACPAPFKTCCGTSATKVAVLVTISVPVLIIFSAAFNGTLTTFFNPEKKTH